MTNELSVRYGFSARWYARLLLMKITRNNETIAVPVYPPMLGSVYAREIITSTTVNFTLSARMINGLISHF